MYIKLTAYAKTKSYIKIYNNFMFLFCSIFILAIFARNCTIQNDSGGRKALTLSII